MPGIIECVPNISEGKNEQIINAISMAISNTPGKVRLLGVEPGYDTNRTVMTFAGEPEAVEEAAFRCIKKSFELIDMNAHRGVHPRQGCTDVCPFIPVSGTTMDECVSVSRRVGRRVAEELGLPVYLYGHSASSCERRDLAYVRKGGYESLKTKLVAMEPDFGPCEFNETVRKGGAINIGARDFLIAFNLNLSSKDVSIAQDIAVKVRESGGVIRKPDGSAEKIQGMLKAVKAIGWYIEKYGFAQISANILNYNITSMHTLYETCSRLARNAGIEVTGSELIGLVPKKALIESGRYFQDRKNLKTPVSERILIETAVEALGLSSIAPFNMDRKVLEYRIESAIL